jgi:hypothetical protein
MTAARRGPDIQPLALPSVVVTQGEAKSPQVWAASDQIAADIKPSTRSDVNSRFLHEGSHGERDVPYRSVIRFYRNGSVDLLN